MGREKNSSVVTEELQAKNKKKGESSLSKMMNIGTIVDLAVSRMERIIGPDKAINDAVNLSLKK